MNRIFWVAVIFSILISGCSTFQNQPYHPACDNDGLCKNDPPEAAIQRKSCSISLRGDDVYCPAQSKKGFVPVKFSRAVLEYDDNDGHLFHEHQKSLVLQEIKQETQNPLLLIVYVHGWHHNAKPGDGNYEKFDNMLGRYVDGLRRMGMPHRVVGIYVGWRGELFSGPLSILSYWGRQDAADRVGWGGDEATGKRFLFHDLEDIANAMRDNNPDSRLLVSGHSFGARVLSRALLPEMHQKHYQPLGPGSLVVTFNAAIGAEPFLPLYSSSQGDEKSKSPTWLNITSKDDGATSFIYPTAHLLLSNSNLKKTIGHDEDLITHRLGVNYCDGYVISNTTNCGPYELLKKFENVDFWRLEPNPFSFFYLSFINEETAKGSGLWANDYCGLLIEYPVKDSLVRELRRTGICPNVIESESPHATRTRITPAGGYMWNIATDKSVIDLENGGFWEFGTHNAYVQTNVTALLLNLMFKNNTEK